MIVRARTTAGYQVYEGPPKSAASSRTVALDRHTVTVLREHRRRQRQERDAAGGRWQDTGYVFTNRHGAPLHPGTQLVPSQLRTTRQAGVAPSGVRPSGAAWVSFLR